MTLFSIQMRATLLILLIVVLRSLFLYKLPKKVFLGLWALVLLRLFIPYTGNLSLGVSIPSIEQIWLALLPVSAECLALRPSTRQMTVWCSPPIRCQPS